MNEAVEIAKNYEDAEVVSFINGILGTFIRQELPEQQAETVEPTVPEEQKES